jgi:adenylate cyclase
MTACPSCGAQNSEGAKFCNECGIPLARADQRRKERKFATALFADLVGSTSLTEQEDPEVVQSVVGRTFDRLAEEVAALLECDARGFLFEVDEAIASIDA